ncbi:hypothetical protein CVT25_004969 [Psilocybe cyanescens]|uniref:Uncharacterized protein n=1 Tax=Psilocybe cyanescens TaxID=93625 RepID=A0A409XTZ8_PSICY|nr:hypothetical protein CVT25_004969 [Psilocybe cyanescens]
MGSAMNASGSRTTSAQQATGSRTDGIAVYAIAAIESYFTLGAQKAIARPRTSRKSDCPMEV